MTRFAWPKGARKSDRQEADAPGIAFQFMGDSEPHATTGARA
jgi:hypothetical protein